MARRGTWAAWAAAVVVVGLLAPAAGAATGPSAPRTPTGIATGTTGAVTLAWIAPSSAGGSPITDYGVARSTDAGVTWGAITWLGSTALGTDSATVPALTCTNVGTGATGLGCRYRISARNAIGTSVASSQVKLWQT